MSIYSKYERRIQMKKKKLIKNLAICAGILVGGIYIGYKIGYEMSGIDLLNLVRDKGCIGLDLKNVFTGEITGVLIRST